MERQHHFFASTRYRDTTHFCGLATFTAYTTLAGDCGAWYAMWPDSVAGTAVVGGGRVGVGGSAAGAVHAAIKIIMAAVTNTQRI